MAKVTFDQAREVFVEFVVYGADFFRDREFSDTNIAKFQGFCKEYVEKLDKLNLNDTKIREDLNNFSTAKHIHFKNELLQPFC